MSQNPEELVNLVIVGAVFGLILALWLQAVLILSRRHLLRIRRFQGRLQRGEEEDPTRIRVLRLWREARETMINPEETARGSLFLGYFNRLRQGAGLEVSAQVLLGGIAGATLLVFVVMFTLTGRMLSALATAAAAPLIFHWYMVYRIKRRAALFERQFLDALKIATGSLKAGHPLGGAFRLISVEIGPPVGELFGEICQEQALGVSLEAAIRKVAAKTSSMDMKLFATSVVVQLQSGGNLVDMMGRLAGVVRDRIRINRRFRVLTAQTQFSKRILLGLPFVLFLALSWLNPGYLEPLYVTSLGKVLLSSAVVGLVLGVIVMNRMAEVRF